MSKLKKPPRLLPEQTRRHHDDPLYHLACIRSRPRDHHLELGRGRLQARFFFNERKTRGSGIPTRHVARHVAARPLFRRRKRARPLMRACSSFGYELFGHLGRLRNRPGGLAPYPSGFPPVGSDASSGEASGADRESEYTMLSGRKGLSSSESPLEAAPALSTGKRRMARRLSS